MQGCESRSTPALPAQRAIVLWLSHLVNQFRKLCQRETALGGLDWKSVLATAGIEWLLVEQHCEDRSALESIRTSYEFLKSVRID